MKNANGTFKPWAEDEAVRSGLERDVLSAYYSLYGIVLTFAFLILPLVFFYHVGRFTSDSGSEDEPGQ